MIEYRIGIANANAHRYAVTLVVSAPSFPVTVSLPVWIPGSYMVREFARHLTGLSATAGRTRCEVVQLDKTTWRIDAPSPPKSRTARASRMAVRTLTLRYEVYGFDPSVRTAYLDDQRGFFNGTSLLLRVHGREQEPHALRLVGLPRGWRVATAMPRRAGRYVAAHYDEAVDHPFELGRFWEGRFVARGVPHTFVVADAWPDFDGDRLLADAKRICETQIDFWHGQGGRAAKRGAAPFDRYLFILHAVDDGYGGLEHRASTALIASRRDLPRQSAGAASSDAYVTLLGLISHEYFHTWNVKRLKPVEHAVLDYTRENPTSLLWFFEGFTSYYDDLLLRRASLIDDARYLRLMARQLNGVRSTPGRFVQSVAQASFDAWTKYYRADEQTLNTTVSYYTKGMLVALALDLTLRTQGAESATLDAVMRRLWTEHRGGPIAESDVVDAVRTVAGASHAASVARQLKAWVHRTDDGPWLALLQRMGVQVQDDVGAAAGLAARWGLRVSEGPVTGVQIKHVLTASAAERAGCAAGDEILAVDGWRVRKLDDALAWVNPKQGATLTVVRAGRLMAVKLKPPFDTVVPVSLRPAMQLDGATLRRRQRWLQGH